MYINVCETCYRIPSNVIIYFTNFFFFTFNKKFNIQTLTRFSDTHTLPFPNWTRADEAGVLRITGSFTLNTLYPLIHAIVTEPARRLATRLPVGLDHLNPRNLDIFFAFR